MLHLTPFLTLSLSLSHSLYLTHTHIHSYSLNVKPWGGSKGINLNDDDWVTLLIACEAVHCSLPPSHVVVIACVSYEFDLKWGTNRGKAKQSKETQCNVTANKQQEYQQSDCIYPFMPIGSIWWESVFFSPSSTSQREVSLYSRLLSHHLSLTIIYSNNVQSFSIRICLLRCGAFVWANRKLTRVLTGPT